MEKDSQKSQSHQEQTIEALPSSQNQQLRKMIFRKLKHTSSSIPLTLFQEDQGQCSDKQKHTNKNRISRRKHIKRSKAIESKSKTRSTTLQIKLGLNNQ